MEITTPLLKHDSAEINSLHFFSIIYPSQKSIFKYGIISTVRNFETTSDDENVLIYDLLSYFVLFLICVGSYYLFHLTYFFVFWLTTVRFCFDGLGSLGQTFSHNKTIFYYIYYFTYRSVRIVSFFNIFLQTIPSARDSIIGSCPNFKLILFAFL